MTAATLTPQVIIAAGQQAECEPTPWRTIQIWRSRARQRRHPKLLAPERLMDVGITLEAAQAECAKPFWRA